MGLFSTVFKIGASLLGARKNRKAQERANWQNSPQGIRANAEAAGFNPLVFAGPGTGGAVFAPSMGDAIANAGLALDDHYDRKAQLKIQQAQLEMENKRLEHLVETTKLRANSPGIYGRGGLGVGNVRKTQGKRTGTSSENTRRGLSSRSNVSGAAAGASNDYTSLETNKDERAKVTLFGVPLKGSGFISNAETLESAVSEPVAALAAPVIVGDAVANTAYEGIKRRSSINRQEEWSRQQREDLKLYKAGQISKQEVSKRQRDRVLRDKDPAQLTDKERKKLRERRGKEREQLRKLFTN